MCKILQSSTQAKHVDITSTDRKNQHQTTQIANSYQVQVYSTQNTQSSQTTQLRSSQTTQSKRFKQTKQQKQSLQFTLHTQFFKKTTTTQTPEPDPSCIFLPADLKP